MSLDAATQKRLNHETDLRFWSGIGYNPGRKLDPHDKYDATMIPIWKSVYDNVLAQYNAGTIVWTQDQPAMQQMVAAAAGAAADVVNALGKAAAAGDALGRAAGVSEAVAAHQAAQDATKAVGMASGAASGPVVHPDAVQAATAHAASLPVQSPQDAAKALAVASAAQHAHDVLTFSMQGGKGVPTGTAPAGGLAASVADMPADLAERHHNLPTKWTPVVALASVGGAILLGTLIVNAATPKRSRRRRAAARVELVTRR